jgi:hypothetical protein
MTTLVPEKTRDLVKNRALELVASLRAGESTDVFDAFWQLDELPVDDVRDAISAWTGPLPDLDRLDAATRLAHGLPIRPLRLRTLSVAKDADVLDLGAIAEQQLHLAGKSWDGADLAPEERLDGEREDSFAGTLERHVLADAEAPGETPLFDVLLFAGDSGVVFAAGTTNVVALIAYRRIETRDRRTRLALEEALAIPDEAKSPESAETNLPDPVETPRPSAAKKVVARKTAKKTAAKKTVAKKVATAKKTVAKKSATAKKSVGKKAAAKKRAVATKRARR